jgi:hypothetical protein
LGLTRRLYKKQRPVLRPLDYASSVHVHLSLDFHRQKFVASYVLPDHLGRELKARFPSLESIAAAKHGLRQWLRLHILAPESLVLPSLGVFLLWHEFVGSSEFDQFSKHGYGHRQDPHDLMHRPRTSDNQGLALTFAMACIDDGLDPDYPLRLPTLFGVDDVLALDEGQHWVLNCGHSACHTEAGVRCVHHELGPFVPDRLPKEIRFGLSDPVALEGSHGPYGNILGY